jgi:thioredoxin reductase
MTTWLHHMPKGMKLKSDGFASNLSTATGEGTLRDYCAKRNIPYDDNAIPVSLETFNDYALDFQRRFVPGLDKRQVISLKAYDKGFELGLEGGELVLASRVVLATGITHFAYVPDVLSEFGPQFVSHSSAHHELERFRNSTVTVVGAGASAVDLAALLLENGARVNLVSRSPVIKFSTTPQPGGASAWARLRHPPSGLGPGLRSRLCCDVPQLFRYLPASLRLEIVRRHLGPSSPWYLRPRVMGKAQVISGYEIESAVLNGTHLCLNLRKDGEGRQQVTSDHVIAATGYRVDLRRLTFMDNQLHSRIQTTGPFPDLSTSFESSVAGLYFAGIAAAGSFGPLLRFMYGDEFTATRIARHVGRALKVMEVNSGAHQTT